MGFLAPKPKINVVEQKAPPTVDDDAVREAGETEARLQAARRSSTDTVLTAGTTKRRSGGLAAAYREKIGG